MESPRIDALLPPEMAAKAEEIGIKKAAMGGLNLFVLSVLAGAFISLGAVFATTVVAGSSGFLPYGVRQLLAGVVFSLGLILVLVGGAELFTGNSMIVMAWANGRVTLRDLIRNWTWVYVGNFVGALGMAGLVYWSGQYLHGNGEVGVSALSIARAKVEIGFFRAIALGILCNLLVCLAVWLNFSARTTTDRVLAIVPPVAAFVAAGFEHSIANMYFVPIGLLIHSGASPEFWTTIGESQASFGGLTVVAFLWNNLLPVTIGNVIGGGVLVAAVYGFVYLRPRRAQSSSDREEGQS